MHGTATATCHDFDLLEICLPNAGTADCQPVLLHHLVRLLVRPLLRLLVRPLLRLLPVFSQSEARSVKASEVVKACMPNAHPMSQCGGWCRWDCVVVIALC